MNRKQQYMDSFQAYAKKYHKLHPKLINSINNLIYSSEFNNYYDEKEKVIELNKLSCFKESFLTQFSKPPLKIPNKIYFDRKLFIKSILRTRLFILPIKCLPSGRSAKRKENINNSNKIMNSMSSTPCFMFLNLQIWGYNIFHKPGIHCGNNFDFSTNKGFSLYMHELYHIYQFFNSPVSLIMKYFAAIKKSIEFDRILFSHRVIYFELEAIAFQILISLLLSKIEDLNEEFGMFNLKKLKKFY